MTQYSEAQWDAEMKWEYEMSDAGKQHYISTVNKAQSKGREATTLYGQHLLMHSVKPVAEAIEARFTSAKSKAGRDVSALKLIVDMDYKSVAYITLRCLLDCCSGTNRKLTEVALQIGKYIEDEARLSAFEAFDKKRHKKLLDHTEASAHYGYKAASMTHGINATKGWTWKNWSASERLHLGTLMVGIVVESTGLFSTGLQHRKGREVHVVAATSKVVEKVEKHLNADILSPWQWPTLIPPKEWNTPTSGGYHSAYMPSLVLIKTHFRDYLKDLAKRNKELEHVYSAINAVQSTPWTINKDVLNVLNEMWDSDFGSAGLPPREDKPLPICPVCGAIVDPKKGKHACFDADKDALKSWKASAGKVHRENAKLWGKRLQAQKIIMIANKCATHDKIYFPYTADFRGRIYAVPMFLHPQGCDISKGLLKFAEGKPLCEHGAKWLAIHGANTFGIDKVSYTDRVAWVKENSEGIIAVAQNPLDNLWWLDADSPYCFLAFCFEWASYAREGVNFVSHLPIALDGTCNGLQHFSAMLRDIRGGSAVNLIPQDKPADIYQEVANVVVVKLNELLASPEAPSEDKLMAQQWLSFGVNRKVVKRPVMVLPYGGTRYSCGDYLEEAITEAMEEGREIPWEDTDKDIFRAAIFLSGFVWDAIGETLIGATSVMKWLQVIARAYNKADKPIEWVSPSGLPVRQSYPEIESRRVKTQLLGSMVYLNLGEIQNTLDKRKQISGISPNFVHSMDASALTLTVVNALKAGVNNFAMIHDSYGTHAADTEILHDIIRNTFADMYSNHDVLQEIYEHAKKSMPEAEIPKPPTKGSLDIDAVRGSLYFFG